MSRRAVAWRLAAALGVVLATHAAADEPPGSPCTPEEIDRALATEQARLGIEASGSAAPGAFARRLALDAWGTLPDPARLAQAQQGVAAHERAAWVAAAVADPRFVTHAAERLGQAWWPVGPGDDANVRLLREDFVGWLERELRAGVGLDVLAAEVLGGEGTTDRDPALSFLVKFGASGAADAAGPVTRRFLGLSWDCARCHDHPFGDATQADFHGVAAFFGRLRVRPTPNRPLVFRVSEAPLGDHRATLGGADGAHTLVVPAFPGGKRLTGGAAPQRAIETSRRAAFARWLTDRENPYFAAAQVNRVWGELFGRPLVAPVDELDLAPDDAHRRLLAQVAEGFARSGYSLPWLYRTLFSTEAYARPLLGTPDADERARAFAAASPRPLPRATRARMLLRVVGREAPAPGEFPRLRAALVERVRALFAEEDASGALLPSQALVQLSDPGLLALLRGARSHYPGEPAELLSRITWTAFGRDPSPAERRALLPALRSGERGFADVLWAVVSSSEFGSNH